MFDKDNDGTISVTEIESAIRQCGLKPTDGWVKDLMEEADRDGAFTKLA